MTVDCPYCAEERSLRLGAEQAERALAAERDALLETIQVVAKLMAPGNRNIDQLCRDMGLACDIARAAIAKAIGQGGGV